MAKPCSVLRHRSPTHEENPGRPCPPKKADKRGGSEQQRVSSTNLEAIATKPDLDLLALHEALEELAEIDPQQGRIVELKFFGGLSIEEVAEVMRIGHATVERDWKMARAWLRRKLE